ncbi:MAG TPA: alcohol dehydrogenase catalytic domain-containing protein [Thermoleophilia bacterium]|nr:alcohol dehydrogenase catalytic domain-containing protein [Thermoleophilia bacterium]
MADIPSTMKAVVLKGPNDFEIQEVPVPKPTGDEVLCRVRAIAICGTDPKIVAGKFPGMWPPTYPAIIGHEWAGEVVALADDVKASKKVAAKYAVGTRVAGEAHKGCGMCLNCMTGHYTVCLNYGDAASGHRHYGFTTQGAYAEYIVSSIRSVTPLPENLTYFDGAMLDSAGVALHGVQRGRVTTGDAVLITGPGAVGNFSLQYSLASGARAVCMIGRGPRLEQAVQMGAVGIDYEKVDDPVAKVLELTGGFGADCTIECAGTQQAIDWAIKATRKGGRLVMAGLPTQNIEVPWGPMTLSELDILGVRANPNTVAPAVALMANGTVTTKGIHTHTFPLDQFGEALTTFVERREGAMKVVLEP